MKNIFILSFFLLLSSAIAGDTTHLKEIDSAKPHYGEALKAKGLKGKVIFFEYWGLG